MLGIFLKTGNLDKRVAHQSFNPQVDESINAGILFAQSYRKLKAIRSKFPSATMPGASALTTELVARQLMTYRALRRALPKNLLGNRPGSRIAYLATQGKYNT